MQSIAASLPQEGEISMTGECLKIRSGELPYLAEVLDMAEVEQVLLHVPACSNARMEARQR